MKGARLLLLLSVGFLLRSLSLFLWGNGGLGDYRKVEAGRAHLAANIEELKRINSGLRREVESLGSDPARVVLEARRLGYFREGQRVVRFQGELPRPSSFTLGSLVRVQMPRERRDWVWKMAGVVLPLAAYTGWALRRRLRHAAVALGGRSSGRASTAAAVLGGRSSGRASTGAAVLGGRSSGKASTGAAVLGGRSSGKASEDRRR
jgi:cell division protein FtsB